MHYFKRFAIAAAALFVSMSEPAVFAQSVSRSLLLEGTGGNTITLQSPATAFTNYQLTFPTHVSGAIGSIFYISSVGAGSLNASWLAAGTNGQVLTLAGGVPQWVTPATGGSVTSFSAGNLSPLFTTNVTNASTTPSLSFALTSQSANTVFAGPSAGGSAAPTFRALAAADIPELAYIKNQTTLQTSSNFHISDTGKIDKALQLLGTSTGLTSIQAGAQGAVNIVYTLPTNGGSSGQYLTKGSGTNLQWSNLNPILNQTTVQPSSNFHIDGIGYIDGTLRLKGTSTGYTVFQGGAQGGSDITYVLPTSAGTSGDILSKGTGNQLVWNNPATNFILNQTTQQSSSNFHISDTGMIDATLKIRERGASPQYYTSFVGGDQSGNVTYTLPTAQAELSGQVLTNDGSGNLSWTDVQLSSVSFAQNSFDDFVMSELDGSGSGAADHTEFSYVFENCATEGHADGNDYLGRFILSSSGASNSGDSWMSVFGGFNKLRLGGLLTVFETRVRIESAITNRELRVGMLQGVAPLIDTAKGVFFKFTSGTNSDRWECITRSGTGGGQTTTINSGVNVSADSWYTLRIVVTNDATPRATFYINSVEVATTTTNVTTAPLRIITYFRRLSGSGAYTSSTDYYGLKQIRN